jgi:hypothetical protein
LAGVFEALEGAASAGGQVYILGRLVVQGDAAATARNILANESLFRFGFLASAAAVAFHLAWAYLIYQLLRPVNRTVSAVAAFMVITCCALQALTSVLYLAPLLILQGGQSLSGFSTAQAQALAFAFIKVNGVAFQLDLVFFGLWCIPTGYLIWRSALLPRLLGALLMLDGVGWSLYLWPPLATFLFPAIAVVSGLAEAPMQVWLIVRGVSNERWNDLARRARMSDPGEDLVR